MKLNTQENLYKVSIEPLESSLIEILGFHLKGFYVYKILDSSRVEHQSEELGVASASLAQGT